MALVTVEGVFKDGKVELAERPAGVADAARVLVTSLPADGARGSAEATAEDERRAAGRRLLARLERGISFGGPPYPKREELYDRAYRYDRGTP